VLLPEVSMTDPMLSRWADGAIALITLRRPSAGNSLDAATRAELRETLQVIANDAAVRCVVIAGEGRFFCTGADLKEVAARHATAARGEPIASTEQHIIEEYKPIFAGIVSLPQPVIAAISGTAAGAGVSLALACDLKVMAQDAKLLVPFSQVGLVTDCGASWSLVRHLGYSRAYELAIEGQSIDANEALARGLVNRVVTRERVLAESLDWATSIAARASLAVSATKIAMRHALEHGMLSTFDIEARLQAACAASADHREGLTAFLENRPPVFGR